MCVVRVYLYPCSFVRSSSLAVAGEHRQGGRRERGGDQGGSSSVEDGWGSERWRGGVAGGEERFDAVRQRAIVQRVAEQDRPPAGAPPSAPTPGPGQGDGGGWQEREGPGKRARVRAAERAAEERAGVESDQSVRGGEQQTVLAELGSGGAAGTEGNYSRIEYRFRERERLRGPAKYILLIFVFVFLFVVVVVVIVGNVDNGKREAKPRRGVGSFSRLEEKNGRESRKQRRVSSLDRR